MLVGWSLIYTNNTRVELLYEVVIGVSIQAIYVYSYNIDCLDLSCLFFIVV